MHLSAACVKIRNNLIIESVDSISRDERGFPLIIIIRLK